LAGKVSTFGAVSADEEPEDDGEVGFQVIALDPGGTTGWSIFQVHPDAMSGDPTIPVMANVECWYAGEFTGSQDSQIDEILAMVEEWPHARLVTEDFHLRQVNAVLDPVEINAILRWACRPRYWVKQQPGLAMGTVSDDRQKAWGYWVPGKPHARDAVKHAITFLKRRKEAANKAARVAASLARRVSS
jgi:hypothetical protein